MSDRSVRLEYMGGTALVRLEEKDSKNTFSPAFIQGVKTAFEQISRDNHAKVVIVYGYDTYFCCGGTPELLQELAAGEKKFTDYGFFRLLLECDIPTISAMQGHALGGGLAFACYADILIFSEESRYGATFMNYGFTPGMGATCILPKKLGVTLANEMLYTAAIYQGAELKQKGVNATVVKRKDVLETALALAAQIEAKPLHSLKLLKRHLTASLKTELDRAIMQELIMHKESFALEEVQQILRGSAP